MNEIFEHRMKVLFQHCDPAGIVFYPRYFEMVNQTVEEWHDTGLGHSFSQMHMESGYGVPTVSIGAEFAAPSHMGDVLTWSLSVLRLGRTSAHLRISARCGDQLRMTATPVLVYVHMERGRPVPWSDDLRAEMQRYLGSDAITG